MKTITLNLFGQITLVINTSPVFLIISTEATNLTRLKGKKISPTTDLRMIALRKILPDMVSIDS